MLLFAFPPLASNKKISAGTLDFKNIIRYNGQCRKKINRLLVSLRQAAHFILSG